MARVTKRVIFKAFISYPHLSAPVVNPDDKNKDPQYSIEARIPKSDVDTIKKVRSVLEEVYTEGAGPDKKKWKVDFREPGFFDTYLSKQGKDGFPLRDGKYKPSGDCDDIVFMSVKNKYPIALGVKTGPTTYRKLESKEEIEKELYAGCIADVIMDVYYNDRPGTEPGCFLSLKGVVKTGEGQRLAGSSPVDLGELYGTEENNDVTYGGSEDSSSDDLPF